jgi:arylsulfatase A-like enzyme
MLRVTRPLLCFVVLAAVGCSPPPTQNQEPVVYDLIQRLNEAEEFNCPALGLREVETLTEWSDPEQLHDKGCFRYTTGSYIPYDPVRCEIELWQESKRIPLLANTDEITNFPCWTLDYKEPVDVGMAKDFFQNSTEVATVEPLEGSAELEIIARGTPALGRWPIMQVTLNAAQRQRIEVTSSTNRPYYVLLHFPGVEASLEISFTNDLQTRTSGDRNLFLDSVRIIPKSTVGFYAPSKSGSATTGLRLRHLPRQLSFALMDHPESLFPPEPESEIRRTSALEMDISVAGQLRESLFLPGPARIAYPMRMPSNATLEFSVAIINGFAETHAWGHGTVRWTWEPSTGDRTILFERFFEPEHQPEQRRWIPYEVGLQEHADEEGLLILETENGFPRRDPIGEGFREERFQGIRIAQPRVFSVPLGSQPPSAFRPHVIIISIDTLRADHVGCYGYHRNTTPQLDRLAAGGVVFEEAFSPASWTLPAHVSLFCALYPSTHSVTVRGKRISPEHVQMGEWFRQQGYRTGAFVDGGYLSHHFGYAAGFNLYQDRGGGIAKVLPAALEWWKKQPPRHPRMMFIHFYDVHSPYGSAEEYQRRFHPFPTYGRFPYVVDTAFEFKEKVDRGDLVLIEEDIEHFIALYDGDIYYADEQLGEFLETLRDRNEWDSTLIVVLSDHGEEFLEHGSLNHGHTVHEELVHVPLIIKFPNATWEGTRVKELASLIDVLPTLADWLGEDPRPEWQGQSLIPLISSDERPREAIYAETLAEFKEITREFRLFVPVRGSDAKPTPRLYDARFDRGEQHDLFELAGDWAVEEAKAVSEVRTQLGDRSLGSDQIQIDAEFAAQLQALGYAR